MKPPFEVSEFISQLTGITNEMLSTAPSEEEVVDKIIAFLSTGSVRYGHNSPFDCRMMKGMFERTARTFDLEPCGDTLAMTKDLVPPGSTPDRKLGTLIECLFGKDVAEKIGFHSAICDVVATGYLLEAYLQAYNAQPDIEEGEKEKIHAVITGVSPWARGNLRRIYINTTAGSIFVDCNTKEIGAKADVDIDRIDKETLISEACKRAGVRDIDALVRLC